MSMGWKIVDPKVTDWVSSIWSPVARQDVTPLDKPVVFSCSVRSSSISARLGAAYFGLNSLFYFCMGNDTNVSRI
jgi:hypothetical protein